MSHMNDYPRAFGHLRRSNEQWNGRSGQSEGADAIASSPMRVLVVTANEKHHSILAIGLDDCNVDLLRATQLAGTAERVGPAQVRLVVVDEAHVRGTDSHELEALRSVEPAVAVVIVSEREASWPIHASARNAIQLTWECAAETIRTILQRMDQANPVDSPQNHSASEFHGILSTAPCMSEVFSRVQRVARTDATVLVTGESGTGKELVARAIHQESLRRASPMLALNCSALPSELVESELFGHTRGAFTGAVRDRAGLFESAHGSTLFLDEIGDLGLPAQAKVLRALENREVTRLGASRTASVDVRVIAATNRPLVRMVEHGEFREDLLFRLDVVTVELPALRHRRADIVPLAQHFLSQFSARYGKPVKELDPTVQVLLTQHGWPGNVRELRNCIESAVVMSQGDIIGPTDLPRSIQSDAPSHPRSRDPVAEHAWDDRLFALSFAEARAAALADFDQAYLRAALEKYGGNIARTARAIGLHRQSLQRLLTRHDLRTAVQAI